MTMQKLEVILMSEITSKAQELGEFLECSVVNEDGDLILKYRQMAIRAIRRERLLAATEARERAENVPAETVNETENAGYESVSANPFAEVELTPRQQRRLKGKAKQRPVEESMEAEEAEADLPLDADAAVA